MKAIIFALLLISFSGIAQTTLNKSIALQPGQKINMSFDFPELIKVTTWDKNEILITGSVSINGGENDEAFKLDITSNTNVVNVEGEIHGLKSLPHRVTVWHKGSKLMFKSEAEYKQYRREHNIEFSNINNGPDIDIFIEIKVPKNIFTKVHSEYGTVEIKNFFGPLNVESTYGKVDAAMDEKSIGELTATTNYGEIYTNFTAKFKGVEERDFHTVVSAKPGTGPSYSFESKYGNVYLRKAL
jgi:hypothetical protein